MKNIIILKKEPLGLPTVCEIENSLEACQSVVDGYIETVQMFSDVILVVNETGRLDGLTYNFNCLGEPIVGTVFFVGYDKKGNFKSLTNKQIKTIKYLMGWEND